MVDLAPRGRLARVLVAWYGLYQAVHAVVNARALAAFARGSAAFPANPPPGGWPASVRPWLAGMAGLDLVVALLALGFVYGYATGRRWWYPLGLLVLSASVYASLLFGVGTLAAGAWPAHALAYGLVYLAFLPGYLLFGLLLSWGRDAPA